MEKEKLIDLVNRVKSGDGDAANALYESFSKDLYFHIRKTVEDPDLAEDLLQETYIEIYQTIEKLQEPAAFVTWSRQIAYHKCTAYFRKSRELIADENEDGYSVFDTVEEERTEFIPHEALDQEDLKETIRGIISQLPPEQRSAIMMRYFEERPVSEIAEIQQVSEGTVKSRLNYGRKSIKDAVEKYEKKNGIKLHCVGIVPLLLWLARSAKTGASAGTAVTVASTAAKTAVAAGAAHGATTVATEGAKAAVAEGTKAAVKEGTKTVAKTAAKTAAKGTATRFIAGIAATAVASSLTTATVMKQLDKPDTVDTPTTTQSAYQTETPDDPIVVTDPTEDPLALPVAGSAWTGYGNAAGFARWFDMTLTSMSETQISGELKLTYGANTYHTTAFSGPGTVTEDQITYHITLATPHILADIWNVTLEELDLIYDRDARTFAMDYQYDVTLRNVTDMQEQTLPTGTWTGMGSDDGYLGTRGEHLFNLVVDQCSTTGISGHLTVSYQGLVDHDTAFTGRCMPRNADGTFDFDVVLETTRTVENIVTITVQDLVLTYDPGTDTFSITGIQFYDVVMEKS